MSSRRLFRILLALLALLALILVAAACGDDGDDGSDGAPADDTTAEDDTSTTSGAPSTTAAVPETGEAISGVALEEVVFGTDGYVTLVNDGAEEAILDGLWLCNQPAYTELSGTLAPGDTVEVAAAELGGLPIEGGAAALYTSNDFTSSDDILDFVQWGAGGGREDVAVAADLWVAGESVEPDPAFGAIERIELSGGPGAWE